jgi:hypothetical protein
MESRRQEIVDRLVRYIKEGRIEVTALFGNQITDLCAHEDRRNALSNRRSREGNAVPCMVAWRGRARRGGCPQRTHEIIRYDRIKRVDLANRLLKDSTPLLEVYSAFLFKTDDPQLRFKGRSSVIEPLRDRFPGSNTDTYTVRY